MRHLSKKVSTKVLGRGGCWATASIEKAEATWGQGKGNMGK
jgi:hypothetical protein